MYIHR